MMSWGGGRGGGGVDGGDGWWDGILDGNFMMDL